MQIPIQTQWGYERWSTVDPDLDRDPSKTINYEKAERIPHSIVPKD